MSSSTSRTAATLIVGAAVTLCNAGLALGQTNYLTAQESDPRVMGWMQGFPPPPDKLITQPDYFSFPQLRWSVCHLRQFLPTVNVSRGIGAPIPLQYLPSPELGETEQAIDALTFTPLDRQTEMTWEASLWANYTDGMLILHKDRVVYERYFGCLDDLAKHAAMSMTKSLTGLLAQVLVAEGRLDPNALVSEIIPDIGDSAFANATVQQVMDMTTGIRYTENYSDPNSDIWKYSEAASPLPKPAGYKGPDGYWDYLKQVQPEGKHGEAFHYKTPNADMLGWIISRVANQSVAEQASQRIWRKMGSEQDGYMTVDAKGVPYAGGGLSAGLRDLGRLGLLMLNEGVINGERLLPAAAIRNIRNGGDASKFGTAYPALIGGRYSSMWWIYPGNDGVYAARGVHGQTIYVDPSASMVLVRLASYPKAENPLIDPTSLPAFHAVAQYLKSRPE